jgi:hypothetical protein
MTITKLRTGAFTSAFTMGEMGTVAFSALAQCRAPKKDVLSIGWPSMLQSIILLQRFATERVTTQTAAENCHGMLGGKGFFQGGLANLLSDSRGSRNSEHGPS